MCKTRKEKEEKSEKTGESIPNDEQKERSYYYDDAHGYEIYSAEDDENSDELTEKSEKDID